MVMKSWRWGLSERFTYGVGEFSHFVIYPKMGGNDILLVFLILLCRGRFSISLCDRHLFHIAINFG